MRTQRKQCGKVASRRRQSRALRGGRVVVVYCRHEDGRAQSSSTSQSSSSAVIVSFDDTLVIRSVGFWFRDEVELGVHVKLEQQAAPGVITLSGQRPLTHVLHSSSDPNALSMWLYEDKMAAPGVLDFSPQEKFLFSNGNSKPDQAKTHGAIPRRIPT
jgi:hypothetical protein